MIPTKKFSRFIMVSLTLIMGIFFFLTATGIYFYRIDRLEKNSEYALEFGQKVFSETLTKQLEHISAWFDSVVSDTTIRDFISNEDWFLLSDVITTRYFFEGKRRIILYDHGSNRFFPQLPADEDSLKPLMEKLLSRQAEVNLFQNTNGNAFITIYSAPIMNGETRIASVFVLYDISKDAQFWALFQNAGMAMNRIFIKSPDGRLYDLRTGEEISISDADKERLFNSAEFPVKNLFPKEILMPVSGFPGMYYAGNITFLDEQIKSVKVILVYFFILILILTLFVSFFIAKVVSKPLENMASEAMQIARAPSNVTLNEEKVEYLEFKQLAHAFNQVLLSLFTAQEELKAEAGEEKKKLEEELHRAMKMEAVGAMAGGVAHDLNNILSGLMSYPELLLMDLPEESPLKKPILTIQKSGEKAAAIVQDMLTLARRNVNVTEVVNLNSILKEYLISPEHRKIMSYHPDVNLTTDFESNLLNIVGSGIHLSKTLMNLLSNALEAMPNGGEIQITTRNEYVDIPISGYDTVNEGDYVVLTIADNGVGIDSKDRGKISNPSTPKRQWAEAVQASEWRWYGGPSRTITDISTSKVKQVPEPPLRFIFPLPERNLWKKRRTRCLIST